MAKKRHDGTRHLLLAGAADSDDRLLDPQRRVLENGQPDQSRRRDGCASRRPQDLSGANILHVNRLFEGDVPAALAWLRTPKKALGQQSPWTYTRSELGAREVLDLIGRLEYGVFT